MDQFKKAKGALKGRRIASSPRPPLLQKRENTRLRWVALWIISQQKFVWVRLFQIQFRWSWRHAQLDDLRSCSSGAFIQCYISRNEDIIT